ncbi:hypothetical protein AX774_g928 [Zancudomyces culisetae]|uniref:Uncharacterized protein n=1 Tax=Zancudomyces culisetae TaxID=1213189 RepID=A0A1R1PX65_ZANCU|nr:hypothetical protein AX774_g928 [Zancudomyces culisetae]|eukprot:OMH85539.1 hypothetical protein AX774_g928 [Zancudomyces culisetae]
MADAIKSRAGTYSGIGETTRFQVATSERTEIASIRVIVKSWIEFIFPWRDLVEYSTADIKVLANENKEGNQGNEEKAELSFEWKHRISQIINSPFPELYTVVLKLFIVALIPSLDLLLAEKKSIHETTAMATAIFGRDGFGGDSALRRASHAAELVKDRVNSAFGLAEKLHSSDWLSAQPKGSKGDRDFGDSLDFVSCYDPLSLLELVFKPLSHGGFKAVLAAMEHLYSNSSDLSTTTAGLHSSGDTAYKSLWVWPREYSDQELSSTEKYHVTLKTPELPVVVRFVTKKQFVDNFVFLQPNYKKHYTKVLEYATLVYKNQSSSLLPIGTPQNTQILRQSLQIRQQNKRIFDEFSSQLLRSAVKLDHTVFKKYMLFNDSKPIIDPLLSHLLSAYGKAKSYHDSLVLLEKNLASAQKQKLLSNLPILGQLISTVSDFFSSDESGGQTFVSYNNGNNNSHNISNASVNTNINTRLLGTSASDNLHIAEKLTMYESINLRISSLLSLITLTFGISPANLSSILNYYLASTLASSSSTTKTSTTSPSASQTTPSSSSQLLPQSADSLSSALLSPPSNLASYINEIKPRGPRSAQVASSNEFQSMVSVSLFLDEYIIKPFLLLVLQYLSYLFNFIFARISKKLQASSDSNANQDENQDEGQNETQNDIQGFITSELDTLSLLVNSFSIRFLLANKFSSSVIFGFLLYLFFVFVFF